MNPEPILSYSTKGKSWIYNTRATLTAQHHRASTPPEMPADFKAIRIIYCYVPQLAL